MFINLRKFLLKAISLFFIGLRSIMLNRKDIFIGFFCMLVSFIVFFLDNFILYDASSNTVENDKKPQTYKWFFFVFICVIVFFLLFNCGIIFDTDMQPPDAEPEKSQRTLLRTMRDYLKFTEICIAREK